MALVLTGTDEHKEKTSIFVVEYDGDEAVYRDGTVNCPPPSQP